MSDEARTRAYPKSRPEKDRDPRRDREMEKTRERRQEKGRNMDQDQWERYREGERFSALRSRDEEIEWRERRREGDRRANGRVTSMLDQGAFRERERERGKGDTFPRVRSKERERRPRIYQEQEKEKRTDRWEGRLRNVETESEIERERAKRRDRDMQRPREQETERERERSRLKEEKSRNGGRRFEKEELDRRRDREREYDSKERRRERDVEVNNPRLDRERNIDREREKDRLRQGAREGHYYSPQRGNVCSDRESQGERRRDWRKDGQRDTKSEGDSDCERDRGRGRPMGSQTFIPKHCRSEGDNEGEGTRERVRERERQRGVEREREGERERDKHRQREREGNRDRRKERDMERYTDKDRRKELEIERWREGVREAQGRADTQTERRGEDQRRQCSDTTGERKRPRDKDKERDRYKDRYTEREREEMREQEERRERERQSREREVGRRSGSPSHAHRELKPKAQSSEEAVSGSDMESEELGRGVIESNTQRENSPESDGGKMVIGQEQDIGRGLWEGGESKSSEREEDSTEAEEKEQEKTKKTKRKMWLEPRKDRERKEIGSSLEEEVVETEKAKDTVNEMYQERDGRPEIGKESSVNAETKGPEERFRERERAGEFVRDERRERVEAWKRWYEASDSESERDNVIHSQEDSEGQMAGENVSDDRDESDREEAGGSDRYESEDGSEEVWDGERERVPWTDDGFVTVSSGGEEEEERFVDCKEFWDTGAIGETEGENETEGEVEGQEGMTTEKEGEDRSVTVFCVIGQTLPRSKANQKRSTDHMGRQEASQGSGSDPEEVLEVEQETGLYRDYPEVPETKVYIATEGEGEQVSDEVALVVSERSETYGTETDIHQKTLEVTSPEDPYSTANEKTDSDSELYQPQLTTVPQETGDDRCIVSDERMTDAEAQSGERQEVEAAVEKRCLSGETWSSAEQQKRLSAAPHMKWAKTVVKEILGSTEEGVLSMPDSSASTDTPAGSHPPLTEGTGGQAGEPIYSQVQKSPRSRDARSDSNASLGETAKAEDARGTAVGVEGDTHTGTHSLTWVEIKEREGLREEWWGTEGDTEDEELEDNRVQALKHDSDQQTLSSEGEGEKEGGEHGEKRKKKKEGWGLMISNSFRDLGNEARRRRRGIRKSTEKRKEDEEEGTGRDRRTRIFHTSEDEEDDHLRFSWGEMELQTVTASLLKTRKRNSKFYNSQLYQQYSENVQNREIFHQSPQSDAISLYGEEPVPIPASPAAHSTLPPACRPLPALPPVPHPHSFSHSISSTASILPLPTINRPGAPRPPSPRLSIARAQSPTLWQDLPGVRGSPEFNELSADEKRLQEVRFEVVTSEASYCHSLDIVVDQFVKSKQLNALLTTQDKSWLFSRMADVRAISHSFLGQLEERVESDVMHFTVCDIISKYCPRFRLVYVPYLTNQSYQDKTYQKLMDENAGFRRTVEKLERSSVCQRLPLRSFLILPFQRITRLKLLVQNIVKRTAPKTQDEAQASKSMKLLGKMIQESNDSITQMKSIESLVSLSAKVDFECKTLPLISPSRRLAREGPVTELRDFSLKETERSAYLHLFNDYLLLSHPKEGGRYTVVDHSPVSELRAENCRVKLHSLQKNLFRLHMASKSLLLRADTQGDKLRWISALSRPHPEIDFTAAQDITQMQCIRAYVAQQPDELSLEKADVVLVHQQSSDGWVEGTRMSDRHRGWAPESHMETIVSDRARKRNLTDAVKINTATAAT